MPRKSKTKTRKKKTASHNRTAGGTDGVVDINAKRVEKLADQIGSLAQAMSRGMDEAVATMVGTYRDWERANPDLALKPRHKLEMVRFGFVGPGGFERCHDPTRLPDTAFFLPEGGVSREIERDIDAAEVLMCPAMQDGVCQDVWRQMKMPPCCLLLLEVHHGLGGGAYDDSVQMVVDDWGKWTAPEAYAASFARAEQAVRKHEESGRSS